MNNKENQAAGTKAKEEKTKTEAVGNMMKRLAVQQEKQQKLQEQKKTAVKNQEQLVSLLK